MKNPLEKIKLENISDFDKDYQRFKNNYLNKYSFRAEIRKYIAKLILREDFNVHSDNFKEKIKTLLEYSPSFADTFFLRRVLSHCNTIVKTEEVISSFLFNDADSSPNYYIRNYGPKIQKERNFWNNNFKDFLSPELLSIYGIVTDINYKPLISDRYIAIGSYRLSVHFDCTKSNITFNRLNLLN